MKALAADLLLPLHTHTVSYTWNPLPEKTPKVNVMIHICMSVNNFRYGVTLKGLRSVCLEDTIEWLTDNHVFVLDDVIFG